jgi:hypothetical protein
MVAESLNGEASCVRLRLPGRGPGLARWEERGTWQKALAGGGWQEARAGGKLRLGTAKATVPDAVAAARQSGVAAGATVRASHGGVGPARRPRRL